MVTVPLDCSDDDILDVARGWTGRLAAEDYDGAFDMLLPQRFGSARGGTWSSPAGRS